MPYQVTERLYVDKDNKVYTESELTERTEAVLLMSEGGELSDEQAKMYGLTSQKKAPAAEAETDDGDDVDEAEAKSMPAPPANKARSASETK